MACVQCDQAEDDGGGNAVAKCHRGPNLPRARMPVSIYLSAVWPYQDAMQGTPNTRAHPTHTHTHTHTRTHACVRAFEHAITCAWPLIKTLCMAHTHIQACCHVCLAHDSIFMQGTYTCTHPGMAPCALGLRLNLRAGHIHLHTPRHGAMRAWPTIQFSCRAHTLAHIQACPHARLACDQHPSFL